MIHTFYKLVALIFMVASVQICCAQTIPGNINQPATTHKNNKPAVKKIVSVVPKKNIVESAVDIKPFTEDLAIAKLNDTSWCIINKSGDEVVAIKKPYLEINGFSEGLALVQFGHHNVNDNTYGYIDKTGKEVIPVIYCEAQDFNDGLAPVCKKDDPEKCGYIDSTMKEVVTLKYKPNYLSGFHNGIAKLSTNNGCFFIDTMGNPISLKNNYDWCKEFADGRAEVGVNGKGIYGNYQFGFINTQGDEIAPVKYDHAYDFSDGMALVRLNDKWLYIDSAGSEKIWLKSGIADATKSNFSDGLAALFNDGKWSFIDKTGKEVIPAKYFDIHPFSEGLAAVMLYDKWGFIDKTGKEVIPLIYDKAYSFSDGLTFVWLNNKRMLIDETGKKIK